MNFKKLIKPAGLFVGSLVVINVGIYFLLMATTPKIGPRAETAEHHGDSLAAMAHADSLVADGPHADSTVAEAAHGASPEMAGPQQENTAVAHASTDSVAPSPVSTEVAETPATSQPTIEPTTDEPTTEESPVVSDAPRREAETAVQAVKDGDSREIAKLAKLLQAMKPADAAAIASQLKTEQIIELMMRMKDRSAGKMLAELPIEQAARVAARMSQSASRTGSGS
ncbi:hypothetical protein KKH27_08780 [bacterium]|nr:hypothetical protein [bacterium]MBU1983900.1 hypothetical protein [bacterium]